MKLNPRLRRHLRWQNGLFALLLLAAAGLLAILASRYHTQFDLTQNGRNSLSPASQEMLRKLDGPVKITVYATEQDAELGDIRKLIRDALAPYLRAKPDIILTFVDPTADPKRAREAGIHLNGEMVVEYGKKSEHLTVLDEQNISNLLMRLARREGRLVMYLTGHGERSLEGPANFDLGDFGRQLAAKGFQVAPLNLATAQDVPANASVLLIASPQVDLLPGEVDKLKRWLDHGGNLLWLADPEPLHGLQPLAETLGLVLDPGTVVDPAAQELRLPATAIPAANYPPHAITQNFSLLTVFPTARRIGTEERPGWHVTTLVEAASRGWVEEGALGGDIRFDAKRDIPGPVPLAAALEKDTEDRSQRVVVVGDGDFLSNSYLGNGGNLDLGINMLNWLAHDDKLITLQPRPNVDSALNLNKTVGAAIGIGFLFALPLLFLVIAVFVWRRRRAS